ncbi:MAG TPA: hypothetical protein VL461_03750 [Dictyobacter sp.]|nr:hypothetical protein [Dictyobacter sp.]
MEATYCPHCEQPLPEKSYYCARCGIAIPVSIPSSGANAQEKGSFFWDNQFDEDHSQEARSSAQSAVTEKRSLTWQKVVESPSRPPITHPPRPPRPLQSLPVLRFVPFWRFRVPPVFFFWLSFIVLVSFVVSGLFGILPTFGNEQVFHNDATFDITPHAVSLGATITLRGSHFTPHTRIGLSRDNAVPVVDTHDLTQLTTDAAGNFSDTVVVDPDWGDGQHTVTVEDASTHKRASFPVLVTGTSGPYRPPHLRLSTTNLDMGTGDQATNSFHTVTLMNIGAGQITWQSSTTQPWLMVSPRSGVFSQRVDDKVTVAVNRNNLQPGNYSAKVLFSSDAGYVTLVVNMTVLPLSGAQGAVMQLSPAVLSFTGADNGSSPPSQVLTVSNPGSLPLQWSAMSDSSWLTLSTQAGTVPVSGHMPVAVQVQSRNLLPGTYSGKLTFTSAGANDPHSLQNIYVSVTITPPCSLQISPSLLSFTSVYQQGTPAGQEVDLTSSANCPSTLNWSVSSSASWLHVSSSTGMVPAHPVVSVNPAHLEPGVYTGSVTFSSSAMTQVVPVTYTLGQDAQPLMSTGVNLLSFSGLAGQVGTFTKTLTLSNIGGGSLSWRASSTENQGSWLTVTPATGQLAAHQSVLLQVTASTPAAFSAGTYGGIITITGQNGSGGANVANAQAIPVSLMLKPPCTLTASSTQTTLSAVSGQTTSATRAITLGTAGVCTHALNWTATTTGAWLATAADHGSLSSGPTGTLTLNALPGSLAVGQYQGMVTIAAVDSVTGGAVGSPLHIAVTLSIQQAAVLGVSSDALDFSFASGQHTLPLKITNTGGSTMNWHAALLAAPAFVTLSASSGTSLAAGASTTISVNVDMTGLQGGNSYTTSVVVSATDGDTGATARNSSANVPVNIHVAAPAMQVSVSSLNYTVGEGGSTVSQAFTITNTGGDGLGWQIGTPSQSWVTVSPSQGSVVAGATASIDVSVDPIGLAASSIPYLASVTITPSTGSAMTLTISLLVTSGIDRTPTVSPSVVTTTPTVAASSTAVNIFSTPTIIALPTAVVTRVVPTVTATASVTVTPAPTADYQEQAQDSE